MSVPKTIKETEIGKSTLRLVEKDGTFIGVVFDADGVKVSLKGTDADDVWRRLHDEAGKAGPRYFGFGGARNRFFHYFPDGFHSEGFYNHERRRRVEAKERLDATVPLERALDGTGLGESVLKVFRQTNLLHTQELIRLQDVLRGPRADPFIQAAARFTLGEGKPALLDMERALKVDDSAKWTVVTYLPCLWRPEEHMFLKPQVTNDFAERVGHRFAHEYEPRLKLSVYESLLDLAATTEAELADLRPRDRLDVQGFIWAVSFYDKDAPTP